MAALEDGEVAQQNVAAVLEGDGLVADAGLLGLVHGIVAARCEMALGPSGRGPVRTGWPPAAGRPTGSEPKPRTMVAGRGQDPRRS